LLTLCFSNVKNVNGVKAAGLYSTSALTTTINLLDSSDETIRNYYGSLTDLNESERKGINLLKNLKPILQNNQKYYKYDGDNKIWQMYEIIDRDWSKSPASEITNGTYDSKTNTIYDYVYGKSVSDKGTNPFIRALYVDRSIDNPKTAWDAHGSRNEPTNIEREHIWPKSYGFDEGTEAGARGDPMHLWAADGGANGIHSNYFYGNVNTSKSYKNSHDDYSWTGNNLFGYSEAFVDSQIKVFEPQDSDKGDIARACFYMAARYNNFANNDDTIGVANPNLLLCNDLKKSNETGTSTSSTPFSLGILKDLLEWNRIDPVDEFEIHRNNLLFNNYTNNRNPFIDFPEWADIIWDVTETTTSANPLTDKINNKSGSVTPSDDIDTPNDPGEDVDAPGNPEDNPGEIKKPSYFYLIFGVVVVLILIIAIVIAKNTNKTQRRKIVKQAQKIVNKARKK